jgi:hypothetical protein
MPKRRDNASKLLSSAAQLVQFASSHFELPHCTVGAYDELFGPHIGDGVKL